MFQFRLLLIVPTKRDQVVLRCHFCGNKLSAAQALELQEGKGFFYVCESCAMSLDPLRKRQFECFRCAAEGKSVRAVIKCDMCGKGVCSAHYVDMHHHDHRPAHEKKVTKYQPVLASGRGKRHVLCDVCAAAVGENEE